jgi:hypothetical protein
VPAVAAQSDDQALRDLWSEQAEACDVAGEKYCLADEAFHAPRVASTTLGPHHSPHAPGAGGHGQDTRASAARTEQSSAAQALTAWTD